MQLINPEQNSEKLNLSGNSAGYRKEHKVLASTKKGYLHTSLKPIAENTKCSGFIAEV